MIRRRGLILPLFFLSLSLAFSSCIKRPKGVASDDRMAPIEADVQIAEAYLRNNPGERGGDTQAAHDAMLNRILSDHGMSREEYDSTMSWYAYNPDEYYEFFDKVSKRINKRRSKMGGTGESHVESNDLWPYSRMAMLSPLSLSDGFDFSMPATGIKPGERLKWRMRLNGVSEGSALFGVEYDTGLKSFITSSVRGKEIDLTLQTDTAGVVTRLFGNVALYDSSKKTLWIDSISLTSLPFDSLEYHSVYTQRSYRRPAKRVRKTSGDAAADSVKTSVVNVENRPAPAAEPYRPEPVSEKRIMPKRTVKKVSPAQ